MKGRSGNYRPCCAVGEVEKLLLQHCHSALTQQNEIFSHSHSAETHPGPELMHLNTIHVLFIARGAIRYHHHFGLVCTSRHTFRWFFICQRNTACEERAESQHRLRLGLGSIGKHCPGFGFLKPHSGETCFPLLVCLLFFFFHLNCFICLVI